MNIDQFSLWVSFFFLEYNTLGLGVVEEKQGILVTDDDAVKYYLPT